jgi:hypothetical protein
MTNSSSAFQENSTAATRIGAKATTYNLHSQRTVARRVVGKPMVRQALTSYCSVVLSYMLTMFHVVLSISPANTPHLQRNLLPQANLFSMPSSIIYRAPVQSGPTLISIRQYQRSYSQFTGSALHLCGYSRLSTQIPKYTRHVSGLETVGVTIGLRGRRAWLG